MTLNEVRNILTRVTFNDWDFHTGKLGNGFYIAVEFTAPDNANGHSAASWKGRKWYVSPHAIREEVVSTAFKAVMTAMEHETREQFRYDGVAVFGPHQSLDTLMQAQEVYRS
jgi:hypothetical protein